MLGSWASIYFQALIIVSLCILIYILFCEYKSLKYQKRFENFALVSSKDPDSTYIDILLKSIWNGMEKVSIKLKKNEFLNSYGEKYDKYLVLENSRAKSGMNYVVIKVFTAFLFLFLNIILFLGDYFYLLLFSSLIFSLFGFFLPDIILQIKYSHQRQEMEENLYQAIIIMNHSFASGKNIWASIEAVKDNLTGPLQKEFKKMYIDMSYGLSIEVVFERFYERTKLEDAKYLATSLSLLNQKGGNIAKIFSNIEKNLQSKKQFRNEIHYLLVPTKFALHIFLSIPPIVGILLLLLNPHYFDPFFETPYGFLTFVFLILIYIGYILTMTKLKKGE